MEAFPSLCAIFFLSLDSQFAFELVQLAGASDPLPMLRLFFLLNASGSFNRAQKTLLSFGYVGQSALFSSNVRREARVPRASRRRSPNSSRHCPTILNLSDLLWGAVKRSY